MRFDLRSMSTTMKTVDTSIAALKMAVKNRPISQNLLFHSDRGVQANPMSSRTQMTSLCQVRVRFARLYRF